MRPQDSFLLIGYTPREATYGAGVDNAALNVWHEVEAPLLAHYAPEEVTNETKVKGHPYVSPGSGMLIKERSRLPITFDANLELAHFLLISLMANAANTPAPPNHTHVVKYPGAGVMSPWSFSFIHASDRSSTATYIKYNGAFCSSLELSAEGRGAIKGTAEIIGDGSQVDASAVTPPVVDSAIPGQQMFFNQINMCLGPNGTESLGDLLEKFSVKFALEQQERDRPSHTTKIGKPFFNEKAPIVTLSVALEGKRGDTIYNYWKNHTKLILDLRITVGANSEFRMQASEVRIPRDVGGEIEKFDGVVGRLEFPLRCEWSTADVSPWVFTLKDQTVAYLAAS